MQSCLSVCKVSHLLRAAGPSIDVGALRAHDDQLKNSLNDMLGCQMCGCSGVQATCSVRNGGLGLRRAEGFALPAFIASRSDAKVWGFGLIEKLFPDDIGELFISTFERGLKNATDALKSRLSEDHANEIVRH